MDGKKDNKEEEEITQVDFPSADEVWNKVRDVIASGSYTTAVTYHPQFISPPPLQLITKLTKEDIEKWKIGRQKKIRDEILEGATLMMKKFHKGISMERVCQKWGISKEEYEKALETIEGKEFLQLVEDVNESGKNAIVLCFKEDQTKQ